MSDKLFSMEEASKKERAKTSKKNINLNLFGLAMFLAGAFLVVAIRFAAIKDDAVHYHANFNLYINGEKDEFDSFTFYEEVASCNVNDHDNVKARVHLHDSNPGLVHVHAHGVTWGQFFANLGYTLGDKVVVTDAGEFVEGQNGNRLLFVINGEPVQSVQNRIIKSEDKLLINYGLEDKKTLDERYASIPSDAGKANSTKDPAACSGGQEMTMMERLKQSMGISSED